MRLPRDLAGTELATLPRRYGYEPTRQTGSHIRLTCRLKSVEHHVTIARHDPLRVGTLSSILADVATYPEISRSDLVDTLFG